MAHDAQPLADRLRPQSLDDVVGQDHIAGKSGILRRLLSMGFLPSFIFWGPPGSGKTTLAHIIAGNIDAYFSSQSAVTSSLKDVRATVEQAKKRMAESGQKTILFLDEIHRFNKAQQDALLPHVEKGTIIFIGATTENPSFEVIAPLLSRCRVLVLKPLETQSLQKILDKGLTAVNKTIDADAAALALEFANSDARSLLTIVDIAAALAGSKKKITKEIIMNAAQRKLLRYDRAADEHYDTISAFIKSMRAGDVDAALHYLARMVFAGEDPLFISRRMIIFASEDIGVIQPTALVVANAVFDACHKIGYPECQENLAHGVVYLSLAKKDRRAYDAYMSALADVKQYGNLPIPLSIRNAPTKLMKKLGYGKDYIPYTTESLLPDTLKGKKYFK